MTCMDDFATNCRKAKSRRAGNRIWKLPDKLSQSEKRQADV